MSRWKWRSTSPPPPVRMVLTSSLEFASDSCVVFSTSCCSIAAAARSAAFAPSKSLAVLSRSPLASQSSLVLAPCCAEIISIPPSLPLALQSYVSLPHHMLSSAIIPSRFPCISFSLSRSPLASSSALSPRPSYHLALPSPSRAPYSNYSLSLYGELLSSPC